MFADDTTVLFHESNYAKLSDLVNTQLKSVDKWLLANKLTLNIEKTNFILFHTPNTRLPRTINLYLRNNKIKIVESVRFLGIVLNERLSWKPHMDLMLTKLRVCTSIVRKIQSYLMKDIDVTFHSMIESHLRYCNLIWCNGNKTMILKLQRTVNKFICLIFKFKPRDSVKQIMRQNNVMTIIQLREFEIACFMHKYLHKRLPSACKNMLKDNFLTNTSRKQKPKIFPTFCRINTTKQSIKYKGPLTWNKILVNIRETESYHKFCQLLKHHLLNEVGID